MCENVSSPPIQKVKIITKDVKTSDTLDISKLGDNVWMDFVAGRNQ